MTIQRELRLRLNQKASYIFAISKNGESKILSPPKFFPMRISSKISLMVASSLFLATACSEEEDNTTNNSALAPLSLNITGLEDLGSDYHYEGWIIVDGSPVSAGIFNVDANGKLSEASFDLNQAQLSKASTYVLTIEPNPDPDPAPSDVHILAGDFTNSNASLSTSHSAAIGTDFSTASGNYILATPTDGGSMTDELSGLWWLDPSAGPGPGLNLPSLPDGWIYEGWVVIDGQALTTGTFLAASGTDNAAPFSGNMAGPPFPGEDFLQNAPTGLNFPTDLSEATVVISVEPVPDNSAAPFLLKPLAGQVPANALDHTLYSVGNNALNTNPSGTVSR